MSMKVLITIKDRKVKISLYKGKKGIDFLDMADEYKLSEELLPEIDKLLKRNKLKPEDIRKMEVRSDQNDTFTTTRIAKTVAKMWNYCLKA
jgi:hypothetical protein